MGIQITSNKVMRAQHLTSNNFALGNCSQYLRHSIDMFFDFDFESSINETVIIDSENSIRLVSGDWSGKGLVAGDNVDITYLIAVNGTPYTKNADAANIQSIQGDTLYFANNEFAVETVGILLPQQGTAEPLLIESTRKEPEEIVYFHNLILNDSNSSQSSLLDGEVNKFVIENVDAITEGNFGTVLQEGKRSGGRYDIDRMTFFRNTDLKGKAFYQLEIYFFLLPFDTDLFDEPNWFEVQECLKPTIQIFGYPQTNNPNSELRTISFDPLANTGWFNESYNGGDNDFTIDSVSITDASNQALSEIDHTQLNKVEAVIGGIQNFYNEIEVVFEVIPPESEYKNNQFSNLQNSFVSYFFIGTGGALFPAKKVFDKNGAEVDNLNPVLDVSTANELNIQFELDPNSDFSNYINSLAPADRKYRISAVVESDGGDENDNNSVALIIKEGVLEQAPIPDQPFNGVKEQGFLNHVQDVNTGVLTPNYIGKTEDDMVFKAVMDLEENVEWERVELDIEVVKDSDNTSFDLFSTTFNIDGNPNTPMVNGVLQLNFEQSLDQFLDAPERNKIELKNTGNTGAGTYEVQLIWSMMANWRYWIANNSAFQEFFDNTLPNNGKSAEWVRYLDLAGYTLKAKVRLVKDGVAYGFGANISIDDYDDFDGTTTHSFFDSQGNQITGLFNGQEILFRADHVLNSGAWDGTDTWGILALRGKEQDPRKQISTFWDWTSQNNPLKPKTGETKATIEILTTNSTDDTARVECLIDGSILQNTDNVPVSRIQSPIIPGCQHPLEFFFDKLTAFVQFYPSYDVAQLVDSLLGSSDLSKSNICCPDCSVKYQDADGDFIAYAFGGTGVITNFFATSIDEQDYCCYDNYANSTGDGCVSFAQFEEDIQFIVLNQIQGDVEYILDTLVPAQINAYNGNPELGIILNGLINMTTDQVKRAEAFTRLLEVGFVMKCYDSGKKTIDSIV